MLKYYIVQCIVWYLIAKCSPPFLSLSFPGGSDGKASVYNMGDLGSIPGSGRSPGGGNGNTLQYSCLENPMDGGTWWAIDHGVAKSQTQLSKFTSLHEWWKPALILEKHFLMQENKTVVTAKSYHLYPGTGVVGIKWVWSQTRDQNIALHLKLQDE